LFGGDFYRKYSARTFYSIDSTLVVATAIPLYQHVEKSSVTVPFPVYDPRLICGMLYPEQRRWKSHIGQKPLEYDIFVHSSVYGPRDNLQLTYRLLVNDHHARRGTRVRKVSLSIKEIHSVGEARCCSRDDDHFNWYHGYPFRVRGNKEVLSWSMYEYPPPDDPYPKARVFRPIKSEKYQGLATNPVFSTSDGIYVDRTVNIEMPDLGVFAPSTGRILIPPDDNVCKNVRPRAAFCQIRHIVQVTVELLYGESITVDANIYLSSISKKRCLELLETEGEVLPSLDYEKLIGLQEWVPEYHREDPLGVTLDPELVKETFAANSQEDLFESARGSLVSEVFHECVRDQVEPNDDRQIEILEPLERDDKVVEMEGQLVNIVSHDGNDLSETTSSIDAESASLPSSPPPRYSEILFPIVNASVMAHNAMDRNENLPRQQRHPSLERLVDEALHDSLL
jgi:hypothetical protein